MIFSDTNFTQISHEKHIKLKFYIKKGEFIMKKVIFTIALAGILGACTSSQPAQQSINNNGAYTAQPQNMLGNLPTWALNPYVEGAKSAVGMVKVGASGTGNARNKAMARARVELANQMEVKVQAMTKDYLNVVGQGDNEIVESAFSQVSKQVSRQTLTGSRQIDMFMTNNKELYVLVAIPNDIVKEAVKGAMNNSIDRLKSEEKLYQEFKADQAQKELDAIMEKEFGQEQGA